MAGISREFFDQYSRLFSRLQQVLDCATLTALLFGFEWLYGVEFDSDYYLLAAAACVTLLVVFSLAQLYQIWRGSRLGRLATRIFLAWLIVFAALTILGFVTKRSEIYSRRLLLTWLVVTPPVLVLLRALVYQITGWLRARGHNSRTLVIGGAGQLGRTLGENILQIRAIGISIRGFFDDAPREPEVALAGGKVRVPVLGTLDDMVDYVQAHKVDMVYLALPFRAEERLRQIVERLGHTTASVYLAPDVFVFSLLQAGLTDLNGIPLISLC